jgi:hypothetical protein
MYSCRNDYRMYVAHVFIDLHVAAALSLFCQAREERPTGNLQTLDRQNEDSFHKTRTRA